MITLLLRSHTEKSTHQKDGYISRFMATVCRSCIISHKTKDDLTMHMLSVGFPRQSRVDKKPRKTPHNMTTHSSLLLAFTIGVFLKHVTVYYSVIYMGEKMEILFHIRVDKLKISLRNGLCYWRRGMYPSLL